MLRRPPPRMRVSLRGAFRLQKHPPNQTRAEYLGRMIVYGIASSVSNDVSDFFRTEDEARTALERVWVDAPELRDLLWIEAVELGEEAPN